MAAYYLQKLLRYIVALTADSIRASVFVLRCYVFFKAQPFCCIGSPPLTPTHFIHACGVSDSLEVNIMLVAFGEKKFFLHSTAL